MPSNIETLAIIVLIVVATFDEYRASFAKETDASMIQLGSLTNHLDILKFQLLLN
jgi:lipoprotein signal peptidase